MKDTEGPLFAAALREKVLVDYEETSRNGTTLRPASWREREEGERQHVSDEGAAAEEFHSILFDRGAPAYFSDLNLDQILSSITAGYEEYDLGAFFYEHLDDPDTISYRQEVFGDLEQEALFETITLFSKQMRDMRAHLAQSIELRYRYQKEAWFVDAIEIYHEAIASLAGDLAHSELGSQGLKRFRGYLADYARSPAFTSLVTDTQRVKQNLTEVQYSLQIKGPRVTVAMYDSEADYSAEVLATFDRFKQGAVKDYRIGFHNPPEMDHVEGNVLSLVARLYPDVFSALDDFCARHQDYFDRTIRTFDREVQFYVSYLEYIRRFRSVGLHFCFPKVARQSKEELVDETFDLALASKLVPQGSHVVCNDFFLTGPERVIVVSGPNQGGKTTFARMFGQLHHLASIGYPVPGRKAQLYLYDQLFTQFEQAEDLTNMRGKLEDDLVRIRDVLNEATGDSVVVLNEIFTSTSLKDSVFLGTRLMERLIDLDLLCVFVTFVEELASLGPSTVSMVSTVVPENPAVRTYKVIRKPADGLAYALAIAEKYGLTYETLKARIIP